MFWKETICEFIVLRVSRRVQWMQIRETNYNVNRLVIKLHIMYVVVLMALALQWFSELAKKSIMKMRIE